MSWFLMTEVCQRVDLIFLHNTFPLGSKSLLLSMINDRISHLIKVLKINASAFSQSLNVKDAVIFNIIKGRRSKPSYELIMKILKVYDKLNTDWLIKGEGSMWRDEVVSSDSFAPLDIKMEDRIRQLVVELRIKYANSFELEELEELVRNLISESVEQKRRLIMMNDRKQQMVRDLEDRLKKL